MLTALLILIPMAGALIASLLQSKASRVFALALSLVQLGITLYMVSAFEPNDSIQFSVNHEWIRSLGIRFYLGIDGIGIIMVLLTNLLLPLIILATGRHREIQQCSFYALALLMQAGLIGVFTSLDAFLYYIFWELA